MSDAAIIQLVGFATLVLTTGAGIVTMVIKIRADARNRELDLKDRELQARIDSVGRESLKRVVVQQANATKELIADNTTITQQSAEQLGIVQERQELTQGVVEQTALDTLHHTAQPVFDDLIDKYKADTLTDQELTQFIERVRVIASDPTDTTAQLPSARLMLQSAGQRQKVRDSQKIVPASEHRENEVAGEQMRLEAEPQQGQSVDNGEGPLGTAKKVAALTEKVALLDQSGGKVETLKKTVDRIDRTTTEIKAAIETAADEKEEEST